MWKSAQLRDKCKTTGAETLPETIGKHNENEGLHARETDNVQNVMDTTKTDANNT